MKDERSLNTNEPAAPREPALTPLGTPPAPPVRARHGDIIHPTAELAVGEGDVRSAEIGGEILSGTSLWKDAWRRLLRNKLAVFGLVVVVIVILASIIGPYIIRWTTGFSYDSIPPDVNLDKSFPPFTAPNGSFSWAHPMGTDDAGRDILARVLIGGRISLMVRVISTLVSLIIGRSYGATAGYLCGRLGNRMVPIVYWVYS